MINNLGRVQGVSMWYSSHAPEVDQTGTSARISSVWLGLDNSPIKPLPKDKILFPDGSIWTIVSIQPWELYDMINLENKTQGPVGPKGDKGEQGLQGPIGPKGDTGPVGPQGPGTVVKISGNLQQEINFASDPQTQLNALSSKSTEQDNRLATIESKNTAQDNKIKAIETKNTEQDNTINTKASKLTKLWNGNLANGADTSITISNADKYKAFLLKGNAFGIFTMVIHNSSAAFSSAYINSEKGVTGITITLASDGKLSWGQCGFYSNGTFSFQDRTGTGYYSLWEVWGIE